MADYIDRLAVLRAVFNEGYVNKLDLGYMPHNKAFREIIEQIPAADVQSIKRGEWTNAIITGDDLYNTHGMLYQIRGYVCNCCHKFSLARFNFCPNCGANMRKEDGKDES